MYKHVIAVTTKEIANDNRVLNYTNALASHGYVVNLICPETKKKLSDKYKFNTIFISSFISGLGSNFLLNGLKTIDMVYQAITKTKEIKCHIIHANDLQGLVVGSLIKRFAHKGAAIVYDAHEYETEANGINGLRKRIYKFFETKLIKGITRFITVSDTIAEEYKRLYGVQSPVVLLNVPKVETGFDTKFDLFREKFGLRPDQRIFLYQGYLMPGRGIEILLNVFSKFDSDKNVVVFMGQGKLKELIDKYSGGGKVFYHEFVTPKEYLNYTSSADVGISFIEDISLSDRYCLPNKLFEYLFTGLPVICSSLPEMKKLVETYNVGVVAEENSEQGFNYAIEQITEENLKVFRQNTSSVAAKYNWSVQESKLIELYSKI